MPERDKESLLPVTETDGSRGEGRRWSTEPTQEGGKAWTGNLRYEDRGMLGSGGMGEVRLIHDSVIGRDIAVKKLHLGASHDDLSRSRFVREARLQGRLEHPSIVPVYDLGVDGEEVFFTMRRIRGVTLRQILKAYRKEDADMMEKYSRRRLLSEFIRVCLAVDFAHERGIVHRDLKPSNIMLGDYGECYILDWGIAKAQDHPEDPSETVINEGALDERTGTQYGAVVGTPGFIPPERILSEGDGRDRRSDIYALGCILFEILAGEPVYLSRTVAAVMSETLNGVEARPSVRKPDAQVPLELEEICVKATAKGIDARYPTARAMSQAIEDYLDGERDVEARQKLAAGHVREAEETAALALSEGLDSTRATALRSDALRKVGRALALDPEHKGALRMLYRLLTDVPDEPPPEIQREFDALSQEKLRFALKMGSFMYFAWLIAFPFAMWQGVREWNHIASVATLAVLAGGLCYWGAHMKYIDRQIQYGILVTSCLAMFMAGRMFGPLVLVPTLLAVTLISFAMTEVLVRRMIFIVIGCSAVVLPTVLELVGFFPPSYEFIETVDGGRMVILPQMVNLPDTKPVITILILTTLTIVAPAVTVGMLRDRLSGVERRILTQHWYMRQLIPTGEPKAATKASRPTQTKA